MLEYGVGQTMQEAIADWQKLANNMADYDTKLAYLLRDISTAISNYRFYCKDCLKK